MYILDKDWCILFKTVQSGLDYAQGSGCLKSFLTDKNIIHTDDLICQNRQNLGFKEWSWSSQDNYSFNTASRKGIPKSVTILGANTTDRWPKNCKKKRTCYICWLFRRMPFITKWNLVQTYGEDDDGELQSGGPFQNSLIKGDEAWMTKSWSQLVFLTLTIFRWWYVLYWK